MGNETVFLKLFKQRCIDIDMQCWTNDLSNSSRLATYCIFKKELILEQYLTCVDKPIFRIALCKFRTSSHLLKIEVGRWNNIPKKDRICDFCNLNVIEDEFHFLLVCPKFIDLRMKYIPSYYFNPPVIYKFKTILSSQNTSILRKLGRYIFFATKLREECDQN